MRRLLTAHGRERLSELSKRALLVAFDFDGTLAPLMVHPDSVRCDPRTRQLLGAVSSRYPVAVVSGRSLEDLAPRLEGTPGRWMVGNHGAEDSRHPVEPAVLHLVARWREQLEPALERVGGVWLENK